MTPMKPLLRAGVAIAIYVFVAGCALPGTPPVASGTATANFIAARNAAEAIAIGKSTQADVIAAFGKAAVVSFDSGYQVWVYWITDERVTGESAGKPGWMSRFLHAASEEEMARGKTEFVILFTPSGVVAKIRIRPAPAPGVAKGS
jgi:hypothetical protein